MVKKAPKKKKDPHKMKGLGRSIFLISSRKGKKKKKRHGSVLKHP